MEQISEEQIVAWAPNGNAVANARKISRSGGFVRRERAADTSFYLGECRGSGKSNYIVSADFLDPAVPVFRCTCPSRQHPCKHAVALLFEILADKDFEVREIPEDILQKRAKLAARAVRTSSGAGSKQSSGKTRKTSQAAQTKKLKKQLEGLDLTAKLVGNLLTAGLGSMGGTSLDTWRTLSKQLGDYYLPGPQRLLNRLILEIAAYQQDSDDRHYESAVGALEKLWTLVKKSRQYLQGKLDSGASAPDDNLLYEELGGVWRLDELEALGLVQRDLRLMQLAFWVTWEEARSEYIDNGCWVNPETDEISFTRNYRPLKALKHVKAEDSVFPAVRIPMAAFYPGDGNRRVRWDGAILDRVTTEDLAAIRMHAGTKLTEEVKAAKNYLKNAMAAPYLCRVLRFSRIGKIGETLVLQDTDGATIALGDVPELEPTVGRLSLLPDPDLLEDQTLLGVFWYDSRDRRLKLQPLSIITDRDIVRLLY